MGRIFVTFHSVAAQSDENLSVFRHDGCQRSGGAGERFLPMQISVTNVISSARMQVTERGQCLTE